LGTDSSDAAQSLLPEGGSGKAVSSSQEAAVRQDYSPASGFDQHQHQQQTPAQLSFTSEVYAVLHVQLFTGADGDAEDGSGPGRRGSTLFSPSVAAAAAAAAQSPFAAAQQLCRKGAGVADAAQPDDLSRVYQMHSVVMLGSTHGKPAQAALTPREQQLLSVAGIGAALLCCLALASGSTVWLLLAAALNMLCMWTAVNPAVPRDVCRQTVQTVTVAGGRHQHNFLQRLKPSNTHLASPRAGAATSAALPAAHLAGPATTGEAAAATGSAAAAAADKVIASGGVRVRLLGASFAREALGLLRSRSMLSSTCRCKLLLLLHWLHRANQVC